MGHGVVKNVEKMDLNYFDGTLQEIPVPLPQCADSENLGGDIC